MKALILFIFSFVSIHSYAQEINFDWKKILGESGHTSGLSIVSDTSGFIYASGIFQGTIDINGTLLHSVGGRNGYLLKIDSLGNLLWSKQFSSNYDVSINALDVDHENNLVLLGNYRVSVSFDTTFTTNNTDTLHSSNMFIAKYSMAGDLLWAKNTGGVSYGGNSLFIDSNNDILITGKSIDISLFDATTPVTTLDSILQYYPGGTYWEYYHPKVSFIAKYSPDGNMLWIEETGGNPQEIISDSNHNIIITGYFMGDTYFDGVLATAIGTETSFLAQYASTGNINWVKTSGGSANWNSGYGLQVDSANNIYQSGQILGNDIEFDGNIVLPFAGTDAFLSKYDVNGNLIWYKLIGTPTTMPGQSNFNSGNALKMDRNGDILLLGYFLDTLTFGSTTLMSDGAYDLMLLKYNPNGEVISSSQYSDYGWVDGIDLDTNSSNDIYITGYTTLNSWNSSFPSYAFIGKINSAIPTSSVSVHENVDPNKTLLYPNPSTGLVHLEFSNSQPEKKIEVFAVDGRKIQAFTTLKSVVSFEIKTNGVYFVLIRMGDEVVTKKVIID